MVEEAISWIPPMDIYEIGTSYVVTAELPGVELRNIKIEFSGLQFTIRGERHFSESCDRELYHSLEVQPGRFRRTFSLPEPVDRERVRMKLQDGLLHVTLPKAGGGESRSPRGNR